jgi:hypothetical protein
MTLAPAGEPTDPWSRCSSRRSSVAFYEDAGEHTATEMVKGICTDCRVVKAAADLVGARNPERQDPGHGSGLFARRRFDRPLFVSPHRKSNGPPRPLCQPRPHARHIPPPSGTVSRPGKSRDRNHRVCCGSGAARTRSDGTRDPCAGGAQWFTGAVGVGRMIWPCSNSPFPGRHLPCASRTS